MAAGPEDTSGNVVAGAATQQTGSTQTAASGQQTGVAQQLGQIQALLSSISENINKVQEATTSDVDTATVVRSSLDPASPQRRQETYAELALSNAVTFQSTSNAIVASILSRVSDHLGALPPIAPRSATGPGNTNS